MDTGAMYRALTLKALEAGVDPADEGSVVLLAGKTGISLEPPVDPYGEQSVLLDGRDVTLEIRSPAVNRSVSIIARHPRVRELMVGLQRAMSAGSVVMEGRDICTRVLPDAELKVFLTADFHERVRRRYRELVDKGYSPSISEVEAEMAMRDRIDSEREKDPLRPAEDSIILDSTGMTPDEVARAVLGLCEGRGSCCTGS